MNAQRNISLWPVWPAEMFFGTHSKLCLLSEVRVRWAHRPKVYVPLRPHCIVAR
jgi:hypothetical protein